MGVASQAQPSLVIVVDNDPDVLRSLQFALEVEDFQVQAFASGEAVLSLATIAGCGCLVLDHQLDGIDGLTLLKRLRQRGHDTPAILITTSNPSVAARAAEAGVGIIEKPLLCDSLVAEVHRLIKGSA
jgi:FixJ family two-component response regulator